jgi:MSHA biogenesis protein MshO
MTRPVSDRLWFRRLGGFSLVEMIIVIVLAGIVGGMVAVFIVRPVEGYRDLVRRAALADAAESALRRVERDVRAALPNSVRITNLGGGGYALEMLPILDAGKFLSRGPACQRLRVDRSDSQFDILGGLRVLAPGSSTAYRLVVNNLGTGTDTDVYTATGAVAVITPLGATVSIDRPSSATACGGGPSNDHITLGAEHQFAPTGGPVTNRRLYVVTTPISYLCIPNATDPSLGTLTRYVGYNISSTQPTDPGAAPLATATSALIASSLSECTLNTSAIDVRNRSLATLTLSVEKNGEKVRLIHQVQLDNSR